MQLMELPVDNIRIDPNLNPRTVMATKEQNKELLQSIMAKATLSLLGTVAFSPRWTPNST
jgi:hypothetical protein